MKLPLAQPHSATPPEMVGIFFAHEKVMSSLDYYYHKNYWRLLLTLMQYMLLFILSYIGGY
jgi:hypothetical protein